MRKRSSFSFSFILWVYWVSLLFFFVLGIVVGRVRCFFFDFFGVFIFSLGFVVLVFRFDFV